MTLIAIEGIDGSGKSTVTEYIESVSDEFAQSEIGETVGCKHPKFDREIVTTGEPTDNWTGDVVYEALSSGGSSLIDFFLFLADRVHNVENVIKPALDDDAIVVTDRYSDSTRAYQTHRIADELGVTKQVVRWWMNDVFEPWNKEPDVVIYLNISVNTALDRCDQADKYETHENLLSASDEYEWMYFNRSNVYWVDAERSVEEVCTDVYNIIKQNV